MLQKKKKKTRLAHNEGVITAEKGYEMRVSI